MLVIGLTQKVGIASTWPGIICQQFGTILPCLCNGPYPPSHIPCPESQCCRCSSVGDGSGSVNCTLRFFPQVVRRQEGCSSSFACWQHCSEILSSSMIMSRSRPVFNLVRKLSMSDVDMSER